jgi:hypothetical protein
MDKGVSAQHTLLYGELFCSALPSLTLHKGCLQQARRSARSIALELIDTSCRSNHTPSALEHGMQLLERISALPTGLQHLVQLFGYSNEFWCCWYYCSVVRSWLTNAEWNHYDP